MARTPPMFDASNDGAMSSANVSKSRFVFLRFYAQLAKFPLLRVGARWFAFRGHSRSRIGTIANDISRDNDSHANRSWRAATSTREIVEPREIISSGASRRVGASQPRMRLLTLARFEVATLRRTIARSCGREIAAAPSRYVTR